MKISNLSENRKNNLRAIFLSVLLPVWNTFANNTSSGYNPGFFYRWALASLVLFVLWQVLYRAYGEKKKYNRIKKFIAALFIIATAYILFVVVFRKIENIRWYFIIKLLMAALLFIVLQYGLRANEEKARLQAEKQRMLAENYKVQLQELRTKVDPHFLFNSLNTLRVMVRNKHEDSEKFIMSLSDFYRQTLKYNESSTVSISEELSVLKSYIFLMESRNRGGMKVNIDVNENTMKYELPTLSLQILIENCFKHNRLSSVRPLEISIYSDNNYIHIRNNKQSKFSQSEPSGFGIDNIRKRYELLGIKAKAVMINETPDEFEVRLKLIGS